MLKYIVSFVRIEIKILQNLIKVKTFSNLLKLYQYKQRGYQKVAF